MRSLLTDPDRFFRDRSEAPTLRRPGVVVSLVGVANLVGIAALLHVSVRGAPAGARGYVALGYAVTAVSGIVGAFAVWLIYAALIHLASARLGGEGSFGRTLWAVGWGFLPGVFASLLYSASVAHAALSLPPPDPGTLDAFGRLVRDAPLVSVMGDLGLAVTAWQGLLWSFGVKHARGLTLRRAGLVAAIPVAVSILRRVLVAV
jgi:hypothetical protein